MKLKQKQKKKREKKKGVTKFILGRRNKKKKSLSHEKMMALN